MSEDKNKELLEKLENGIKETLNSEKYKAFLKIQSQFHSYSFNNAMLIYVQKPNATRVAGYKSWQKYERNVMKGEKGIKILAPNPYKYEKEVDKLDPVTKKPVIDSATGKVEKVKVELNGTSFKQVTVFDVSQTQGKELPSICNELQGNSVNAEKIINAIKNISEVPIVEKDIPSGAKGYYSRAENLIALKEGMSLDQTAKTLIHEYAHSILHCKPETTPPDNSTREVQAESVAYIVSDKLGVDTSEYSFEYLANWSSGKELPELKKSFDLIQKTSDKIIQQIEAYLSKDLNLEKNNILEQKSIENIKDKIIELYKNEFSSIEYISDDTAKLIDSINNKEGKIVSIKELKDAYNKSGELLEENNNPDNKKVFDVLQKIVNDFKQSELKEVQVTAREKTLELNTSKSFEMVQ